MKTRSIMSSIESYGKLLRSLGHDDIADRLTAISPLFKGFLSKDMKNLLAQLAQITAEEVAENDAEISPAYQISDITRDLNLLVIFLKGNAGSQRAKDILNLDKLLSNFEQFTINQFVAAVMSLRKRPPEPKKMHRTLAEKLKNSLGTDSSFQPLFDQLGSMETADVSLVTEKLMGFSFKSTKKNLHSILDRHNDLKRLLAKGRYMDGRSAA